MSVSSASSSASSSTTHISASRELPAKDKTHQSAHKFYTLFHKSLQLPVHLAYLTLQYLGSDFPCTRMSNQFSLRFPPKPEGWSSSQVTAKNVQRLIVEKTQLMAADAERRMEGYRMDSQFLDRGFWYRTDYFECLEEIGATEQLNALIDEDAFFFGHPPKGFHHEEHPQSKLRERH